MVKGLFEVMEDQSCVDISDLELNEVTDPEGSAGEKAFVGACGLSPVRELLWVSGLIELDEPALWETL